MLLLPSTHFVPKTFFFLKNSFRNTIRVSNGLVPDWDRHSVGPDLAPNYLPRLSVDDQSPIARKELC